MDSIYLPYGEGMYPLYTDDGKAAAAFGSAVRALCVGKSVYVGQFVKSMKYNETKIERLFDGPNPAFGRIRIEQLGRGVPSAKNRKPSTLQWLPKGYSAAPGCLRATNTTW